MDVLHNTTKQKLSLVIVVFIVSCFRLSSQNIVDTIPNIISDSTFSSNVFSTIANDSSRVMFPDSLSFFPMNHFQRRVDKVTSSRLFQMTYTGVPLVISALIVKGGDRDFRSLRNGHMPRFDHHLDDYLQYLPAAVMLGVKVGGVKGRSSWGRMLVSDAFSAVIMSAVVRQLKVNTKVERPDASNKHSFPSGHTATAFMTATMLSKEYGSRSPWFSIGAYTVATGTGLMRMANNKHWLSDVLTGAGIGILSTELGYYLADLIFKDKGINHFGITEKFDRQYKPSYLGLNLGINIIPGDYILQEGGSMHFSSGCSASIEGAWFISPYMGIGGRFSAAGFGVVLDNIAELETLDLISGYAGAYFSYPITPRILIGGKILGGYSYYPKCQLSTITIGEKGGIGMGTGISITFLAKQNLGIKFFADYNLFPTPVSTNKKCTQIIILGSSVSMMF